MLLKAARVTNFRSVEDSGEFTLDQVTCLVGKNEAGKTAILTALSGFNPHPSSPFEYHIERDYPRRHLNDYASRHSDDDAIVATLDFELEASEISEIEDFLCEGALSSPIVRGVRRYRSKEPEWDVNIDYEKVIGRFIADVRLSAAEKSQVGNPKNTQELRVAIKKISEPSEKFKQILARLDALPGSYILGAARDVIARSCPSFMYFSYYDRMVGEVRLDTFQARINGSSQPSVESGERVFLDFLHFAGTSLEEINSANTYETLNARCESASIKITDQLLEYWRQNPNLSIDVRVTKGEPSDPAPFNAGIVARARVRNDLQRMTVPFSERSAGFVWFFSFLVKFAQVKATDGKVVLVLDEPGLTLHGTAQNDLLRYFDEKLAPHHQVVFSTHSPFMVPAHRIMSVRVVEDKLYQKRPGVWDSEGTQVREDALTVDRDTLFPLQGALGYEITQSLFVGKHTALVEGPSDILYIQIFSDALGQRGRTQLDARWTMCPAGGLDKIQSFLGLFGGRDIHLATMTDFAKGDKKKLELLKERQILEDGHLLTFASVLGKEEADVEDIFDPRLFAHVLNEAYSVPSSKMIDTSNLDAADENTSRLVKKAEAIMRVMPAEVRDFSHFGPAGWLLRNSQVLDGEADGVPETLDNAELVIKALNALLP